MHRVAIDASFCNRLITERDTAPFTQGLRQLRLYAFTNNQPVDTVAMSLNCLIHLLVRSRFADRQVVPYKTCTALQRPLLKIQKRRIHIHYVAVNAVQTRIGHQYRVVQDRIRINNGLPRIHRDRVTLTDLVVPRLNDAILGMTTHYCCGYDQRAAEKSIEMFFHIL